jgi:uncharacterized protein (DUF1800 family)
MPDLAAAALAAHRFGFGPKPGELRAIAGDPRGWVKSQLGPTSSLPPQIASLPPAEDDLLSFGRWQVARRLLRNADAPPNPTPGETSQRRGEAPAGEAMAGASPEAMRNLSVEQDFIDNFRPRVTRAVAARVEAAMTSDQPARERLVHFWSNHFTVSTTKPAAVALPPSFERDAIRPHVGGRFADMLLASTKHPGMIVYLDNWLSVGPHSAAARAIADRPLRANQQRPTGINENLGREIMELHTLGVGGGYDQADVQALATIITGWSFDRARRPQLMSDEPGTRSGEQLFKFMEAAHEPGPQTLLGRVYAQDGVAQGEAALEDLARRPATARFVASKLCRHYIADDPPPDAVARVAGAFQRSGGDLRVTMETLVDCPQAWALPFAKFKQPEEYAVTLLRAANVQALPDNAPIGALVAMGQRPYAAPGPNGWADIADAWLTPDLVWKRLEFAQTFAARIARADVDPLGVGDACLGPLLSDETKTAIQRASSPAQGLAILFAAPEMQRR